MKNKFAVALGKMARGAKKTMSRAAMIQRKRAAQMPRTKRVKNNRKKS